MIHGLKNKRGEFYNQDQALTLFNHMKTDPKWLIIGGPADGNEAQCFVKRWPDIRVIGLEPYEPVLRWQLEHGWPTANGELLNMAISHDNNPRPMYLSNDENNGGRASSLEGPRSGGQKDSVFCISLDTLEGSPGRGPWDEAFLWLDIEGWEVNALMGAVRIFTEKKVRYVNIEMMEHFPESNKLAHDFLTAHKFKCKIEWNNDKFYVRKK